MTDMSAVEAGSMDAVWSSHNIEHLFRHEVPIALGEFRRVLKPDGRIVITCPDLQSVAKLVAEGNLEGVAYTAPAGPITPLDILYGYGRSIANGNVYMAHRTGFTRKTLAATAKRAGFERIQCKQGDNFDLWMVAYKPT
ncbi:MAG: class I SAM-dependent methyltransferase [Brevundimonas sp.]|jgi:ubiquinone/menaquinone biosynthesis C-methylase UbiE